MATGNMEPRSELNADDSEPKFSPASDWKRIYPELSDAFGEILRVEDFEQELIQGCFGAMAKLPLEIHSRLVKSGLIEAHIANRPVPELDKLQHLHGTAVTPNSKRIWNDVPGAYTNGVLVFQSQRSSIPRKRR